MQPDPSKSAERGSFRSIVLGAVPSAALFARLSAEHAGPGPGHAHMLTRETPNPTSLKPKALADKAFQS